MSKIHRRKWNAPGAKVQVEQVFTKTTQTTQRDNWFEEAGGVLEHYKYINKGMYI